MSSNDRTRVLAQSLARERAGAEKDLWSRMAQLGLLAEDGWSIVEFTREALGGTEFVLRPLHLHLSSPPGVECIVGVVEDTMRIHTKRPKPEPER